MGNFFENYCNGVCGNRISEGAHKVCFKSSTGLMSIPSATETMKWGGGYVGTGSCLQVDFRLLLEH